MGKIVGKVFEEPKEISIEGLVSIANEKGLKSLNKDQLKAIAKDDLVALIEENKGEE